MTLIADIQKLWILRNVVRKMSKKSRFRRHFDKQHGKWDQIVLKFEWQHFYHIYWSLWTQLSSKESLLVTGKILGLLSNTLAACHKYSLLNRDNVTQLIQMESSLKRKTFSQFFSAIFEKLGKFWTFLKKDYPHSWCIL